MSNSGDLNATYHDYFDGQRLVETRSGGTSGGGLVIRHQVWGLQYIDELVQVTVNRALLDDPDMDASDPDHDVQAVYAVLDPMFSLLGLIDASGDLVERYELDPYGRRQVFGPADANDTTLTLALNSPARVDAGSGGSVEQPYALTDVSHQGLPLDENTSLLYNRARYRNPTTGRFISRDPLGYPDGMNGYASWHVVNITYDPTGLFSIIPWFLLPEVEPPPKKLAGEGISLILDNTVIKDWAGREIFNHWIRGSGRELNFTGGRWASYMRSNRRLTSQIKDFVWQHALSAVATVGQDFEPYGQPVRDRIQGRMENGFSTGYEMLHMSNNSIGNLNIVGDVFFLDGDNGFGKLSEPCKVYLSYGLFITWNDIIDPNPKYPADVLASAFLRFYATPKDYVIRIKYTETIILAFNDDDSFDRVVSGTLNR